jgi:hypothetical protein
MKSPEELSLRLARQWDNADLRESRLLNPAGDWPVSLTIGKPSAKILETSLDAVKRHLEQWRKVQTGKVIWEPIPFRATSEPVEVPLRWELDGPQAWANACAAPRIRAEFDALRYIFEQCDLMFRSLLIRRRSLWQQYAAADVIRVCKLAMALEPGCALGKPLRAITLSGSDTKFIERNKRLLTALLDVRFDGEVSHMGLEAFLDAANDAEHWLLVADLDGTSLQFRKQRVASSDLIETALPSQRILVVENERSLYQLPQLENTIAVLGTGLDLAWTNSNWLRDKTTAYWGDIDTWGLLCLSRARAALPHVQALMMTRTMFEKHEEFAVAEPLSAGPLPPSGLTAAEGGLYEFILSKDRGRLEQEFLPTEIVHQALSEWISADKSARPRTR